MAVTLEDSVADLLDRAAESRGQSREAFIEHALEERAAEHKAFLEFLAVGERDIAAGRVHSENEVRQRLAAGRARARAEIDRRRQHVA